LLGVNEQKRTVINYTQDITSVSFQTNPRVTDTTIIDSAQHQNLSTISYTTFTLPSGASCSLPSDVYQYQADTINVLRRSHTIYNLDATYVNQHIIGLPETQLVCDGSQGAVPCTVDSGTSLVSRIKLQYDENSIQNQGAITQHDETNYGASFLAGRGNPTSVRRYDVFNMSNSTISSVQYNTAGSPVTATDALEHQSSISYADSFSADGNNVANPSVTTLAYPTAVSVSDPNPITSYIRYNHVT